MTNDTTSWTTRTLFLVQARGSGGTPFDVLYGDEQVAFDSLDNALAQASYLNTDRVWGANGDKAAGWIGLEYGVDSVKIGDLEEGPWLDDAIRRGLIPLTAERLHGTWVVVDPEGGHWWPDEATHAEIERERNPEQHAIALCLTDPSAGEWKS